MVTPVLLVDVAWHRMQQSRLNFSEMPKESTAEQHSQTRPWREPFLAPSTVEYSASYYTKHSSTHTGWMDRWTSRKERNKKSRYQRPFWHIFVKVITHFDSKSCRDLLQIHNVFSFLHQHKLWNNNHESLHIEALRKSYYCPPINCKFFFFEACGTIV